MNEEEKRSIKFTKEYLEEEKNLRDDYKWKSGFYANGDIERLLNLIEKQQREIENIKEYINSFEFLDWHLGFKLIDELEYRKDRINELLGE